MPQDDRYQHYEVLKRADGSLWELGRGAMGVTYKAFDTDLRRTVALKVINSVYLRNDTARQRFLREARAAAALRHQNVASVFHLGLDHGDYFYAMEFVEGQTIDGFMKEHGKLTPLEALDVAGQVTRALAMAARQGLVHRDLKPSNLMLVDEEGERVVKVIDFGLAKSVNRDAEESRSLTMDGSFIGTPHFASPEQLEERDIDARSDIYSLGATLFYLVTGTPPFTGSVAQIMSQHLYKPVPTEPLEGFPPSLVNLIIWMMEKDRDKRPQSAAELRQSIQVCLRELNTTEITGSRSGISPFTQQSDTKATISLSPSSGGAVTLGSIFAGRYRVDQTLPDKIPGKCYRGVDLGRQLKVSLLVLSREYLADTERAATLEEAVHKVRNARHPGLRQIIAFEAIGNQTVLVEEFVTAPSLLEILRARGLLAPVEVVAVLQRLAPVADHARQSRLGYVDFTLAGIQFIDAAQGQDTADLGEQAKKPLILWSGLTAQVAPIDFVFQSDQSPTWSGGATMVQSAGSTSLPKGSYVRQLSLLAYELLGGSRGAVENQGRYTPLASLPEEGNHVLRSGLIDEIGTAGDLAHALAGSLTGRTTVPGTVYTPTPEIPLLSSGQSSAVEQPVEPAEVVTAKSRTSEEPLLTPLESFAPGSLLARNYWIIRQIGDFVHGRKFLADDVRHKRRVSLLVLSNEIFSDPSRFTTLEEALDRLRKAPHPLLREIYSLETVSESTFLVEEDVIGPSLLDLLRMRNLFSAPEIVQLVNRLAPLADHARDHALQQVDFTLVGIHLTNRASIGNETGPSQSRLTNWEALELKVDPIDFSFLPVQTDTWAGMETRIRGVVDGGPRGSGVRLLSLLAYELLGGQRRRVESTGQYTPIAALTEEGNAVLRRGLVDDYASAIEFAADLAAAVALVGHNTRASESTQRAPKEPSTRSQFLPPPEEPKPPDDQPIKRKMSPRMWHSVLALGVFALIAVGAFIVYSFLRQPAITDEIASLSIQSEPAGASVLLDGAPPQQLPGTFTHVRFGKHRLTALLDGYEPLARDVQVREGMAPNIRLKLIGRPPPAELPTLAVRTEPGGAAIMLDGKTPQIPPNTFTHIPFGTHQITATLDGYEFVKQEVQVQKGMVPEIRLQLKPILEIAILSIRTDPAGAAILLDGKSPQVSPNTFTHVPFGAHQISATLDDYEPVKQEIQVQKGMAPEIRLQLKPILEIAALSIKTDPPGAAILLDGKTPQVLPSTFTRVPFGNHHLVATLDDYEPVKLEIQVRKGMSPEIRLQLKPIQEIAALSVKTDPAGAAILLDGKSPQIPPNTFAHIPFGTHQVTAALDDYEPVKQDIEVRKGMAPEIRLQLKPILEIAALSVKTDPAGAAILLDGKSPQIPQNTFTHVPFGTHQVTAALDDYESVKQDIQVSKGMVPEIRLQLTPIPQFTDLSVKTEPAGAAVLLDGKYSQAAGNTFTNVPFGTHQLTATLDDYEPVKQEVEVRKGMTPEIRLQLKPSQEKGRDAFEMFRRNAESGDSYAMMKLGRLYLKKQTPEDDVEGFKWLTRAYEAPNPNLEAGAYIGDCYLVGRGTKSDLNKAEEIIIPLAKQNVVPAMTLAGRIFALKGGLKRLEAQENTNPQTQKKLQATAAELEKTAREWWERAEKDDWNASARLGNCYEDGWGGLPKNEEEAETRYKAGVNHGNPLSMFYYGRMIANRAGRRTEAQTLFVRAAAAGLPAAVKWCKENKVDFAQAKSEGTDR